MLTTLRTMTKKRARMGRPPKPANKRLTEQIHIVVTPEQKKKIMAAAESAGVPLNQWLRELALAAAERIEK